MTPLTPARLAAVYDMLRAFPPFSAWKLPPASEVRFKLSQMKHCHAAYQAGDPHEITLNPPLHYHLDTVVASMAHEMIHLGQELRGRATRAQHNADYRKTATAICKRYGWDIGQFIGG
jgi:hypothetical protein